MPDKEAFFGTLEWFAAALTGSYAVSDVLHLLVEQVSLLLGATGAGVLLLQRDRFTYATSTSAPIRPLAQVVEKWQIGACVEAGRTGLPVAVPDIHADSRLTRCPAYVEQADRSRIRAVAAVPMVAGTRTLGALGLWDEDQRDWSKEDLRAAGILANLASCYLVQAAELDDQRRLSAQLQHALDSRVVIEQAKGIVAVERHIDVDQAFAFLRKQARDHNQRLHDVCERVVSAHRS